MTEPRSEGLTPAQAAGFCVPVGEDATDISRSFHRERCRMQGCYYGLVTQSDACVYCGEPRPIDDQTYDWCAKCGRSVPVSELGDVRTAAATHLSPAETEQWCTRCRQPEPEWDEHEREAARAMGNDFKATNGKDWT